MAKPETRAAWGIDIGLCGLKAIKLKYVESANQVMAVAFDYVPHPKILSQPDANPDELIGQALDTFLSRNTVKGDVVSISVPGANALAKFIQLPPVESSKIGEIVKYEARQQIPFSLDEVVWDFQPLGSGMEEGGFLLDCEVGLFAMKREHVHNALRPFTNRKVEVDLIQTAPIALYNFLCHDVLGQKPGGEAVESDEFIIVLDMGADTTTILVSNGKKIWLRNVHLGGNHFTRALTKEMKLTFAKAEHLKCNATKAPDPKAIFQALRPVFNDYAAEIQRSIGYFSSVNRNAKIKKVVGLGGGFKLAGLQKFLQQNLQMEVERVDTFSSLAGDSVLNSPLFQENMLSFGVPYGTALQALNLTRVHTSLLPREMKTARMIRAKKPWAIAAAAMVLLGLGVSNVLDARSVSTVSESRFGDVDDKADQVAKEAARLKSEYDAAVAANKTAKEKGEALLKHAEGRTYWLEVYKAINECLPRDAGEDKTIDDPSKKHQIRLLSITTERYPDLKTWYDGLQGDKALMDMRADDIAAAPTGPGYVFTLRGLHFHYDEANLAMSGQGYLSNTFLANLKKWMVQQPGSREPVPVRQIGITHVALIEVDPTVKALYVPKNKRVGNFRGNAEGSPMGEFAGPPGSPMSTRVSGTPMPPGATVPGSTVPGSTVPGSTVPGSTVPGSRSRTTPGPAGKADADQQELQQTDFIIQFCWRETPVSTRQPTEPTAAGQTAQGQTPAGQTQPGQTQPGQTPPGQTPPAQTPPGATTPATAPPGTAPPATTPPGTTPPGTTPPGTTPPGTTPTPDTATPPGTPAPNSPMPGTPMPGTPMTGTPMPGTPMTEAPAPK